MRTAVEARRRWRVLKEQFQFPSVAHVKQALKSGDGGNPCEDGLRSICWRAFILREDVDRREPWLAQVSASRDAYTSLRGHFLKYIEHPDDLPSTADPLAEDEGSPWQILRRDEGTRAEIFQDVERCLQENAFFSEPTTKAMMLDILFIYDRLNPDLGYRQGMHELLAPVLWAVFADAIDKSSLGEPEPSDEDKMLLRLLDSDYIEHDAFSLFCAVMHTAKQFYEPNDSKNSGNPHETSSIVLHSQRIHQIVLRGIDAGLADHLQVIDILPQIFLTRWIRLLFGREFSFEDTLSMWDLLFSENLELDLLELVCVAMLLRIRHRLLSSDYSSALGLLLRYPSPEPYSPANFVLDGLFLKQNPSPNGASSLLLRYFGNTPGVSESQLANSTGMKKSRNTLSKRSKGTRDPQLHATAEGESLRKSSRRANRNGPESLFQDAPGGLYRRTEGWGVAKAVRGAMEDARRNIEGMRPSASSPALSHANDDGIKSPNVGHLRVAANDDLNAKLSSLESRNISLAKSLGESLAQLRIHHGKSKQNSDIATEELERAIDTIHYVQTCLEGAGESVPERPGKNVGKGQEHSPPNTASATKRATVTATSTTASASTSPLKSDGGIASAEKDRLDTAATRDANNSTRPPDSGQALPARPRPRAPLADSDFSWMLGDSGPTHSFMKCASAPPERKRESENRERPKHLFGDNHTKDTRKGPSSAENDGVVLDHLQRAPEY